jgi:hypothetical protein
MNAEEIIQDLAVKIYKKPLSQVRDEIEFPNLENPFHLVVLLIDCDTEISMNGMLGFLENMTGRHLGKTVEALERIRAPKSAALFRAVQACMKKHEVTWAKLRGDFEGSVEYQITSFQQLHGKSLDVFAHEVSQIVGKFELFNPYSALEDTFGGLCEYSQDRVDQLHKEIQKRS